MTKCNLPRAEVEPNAEACYGKCQSYKKNTFLNTLLNCKHQTRDPPFFSGVVNRQTVSFGVYSFKRSTFPLLFCVQMFDWIMHNKGLFLTSYTEIGGNHQHAVELQTQHNHFAMNCMVRHCLCLRRAHTLTHWQYSHKLSSLLSFTVTSQGLPLLYNHHTHKHARLPLTAFISNHSRPWAASCFSVLLLCLLFYSAVLHSVLTLASLSCIVTVLFS